MAKTYISLFLSSQPTGFIFTVKTDFVVFSVYHAGVILQKIFFIKAYTYLLELGWNLWRSDAQVTIVPRLIQRDCPK